MDKCAVCRLTMCDTPAVYCYSYPDSQFSLCDVPTIYYSSYLDSQFSLCDVPVRLFLTNSILWPEVQILMTVMNEEIQVYG